MLRKISVWFLIAFLQVIAVLSQQQEQQQPQPQQKPQQGYSSQQQLIQGMTPTQMWNPYAWSAPYYAAAGESWVDYIKKAQEVGNQLYQQWDKSGASQLFNMGMGMAQQYAKPAQELAMQYWSQANQAAQSAGKTATDAGKQLLQ